MYKPINAILCIYISCMQINECVVIDSEMSRLAPGRVGLSVECNTVNLKEILIYMKGITK